MGVKSQHHHHYTGNTVQLFLFSCCLNQNVYFGFSKPYFEGEKVGLNDNIITTILAILCSSLFLFSCCLNLKPAHPDKVHCLLHVLAATPQLLPPLCPPRPCLVYRELCERGSVEECVLGVRVLSHKGHSSMWEIDRSTFPACGPRLRLFLDLQQISLTACFQTWPQGTCGMFVKN